MEVYFLRPINAPNPALICFSTSLAAAWAAACAAALWAFLTPASTTDCAPPVILLHAAQKEKFP